MRYGISVPNMAEPRQLLDVARAAEASGWDGFFLWDHIVVDRATPPLICEPWTVLAAVATVTSRVRIGTMVTPVARRRPWVLARQVTTVDHLSAGRAVLGVGLGVPPAAEYETFGESPDPRRHGQLLDEGLAVIDALWSGEPVHWSGAHFEVQQVQFLPPPVQRPRVPVWAAAALPARAGVIRAARWDAVVPIYSDGVDFRPVTPPEVADVVARIRRHRTHDDAFDVVVWVVAPDPSVRQEYEAAGATWLIEGPAPGPDWLDDAMTIVRSPPPAV